MTRLESDTREHKRQWSNDCLKVVSAFANSKGGLLFIGISDSYNPILLNNITKLVEDIPNTIRNKLGIVTTVVVENFKGTKIIKIEIIPSSVPISFNGKFYLRSGSTVQELQGKHLADFLMKKVGSTGRGVFNILNNETLK